MDVPNAHTLNKRRPNNKLWPHSVTRKRATDKCPKTERKVFTLLSLVSPAFSLFKMRPVEIIRFIAERVCTISKDCLSLPSR